MHKLHSKIALAFLLSFIGFLPSARAVNLSLVVNPSLPFTPDKTYPGSGSTVTKAIEGQTGFTFLIAGRNYGVDPGNAGQRWGLRAGNIAGQPTRSGFIITNGFSPSAAGARTDRTGNGASYVSISVGNVQPGTVFQNLSVDFDGVVLTRSSNAWGAASEGGFANWSVVRQSGSGNGRQLSVAIPDFTFSGGSQPLEFRVYGITGTDEGAFANLRITASVSPAAVPEPAAAFFIGLLALTWYLRRLR